MRRNEYHHTGQQLKDDWNTFHESGKYQELVKYGFQRDSIFKIFEAGWWAGRVAQLNHRPIKDTIGPAHSELNIVL
jgi:hypothetical protein